MVVRGALAMTSVPVSEFLWVEPAAWSIGIVALPAVVIVVGHVMIVVMAVFGAVPLMGPIRAVETMVDLRSPMDLAGATAPVTMARLLGSCLQTAVADTAMVFSNKSYAAAAAAASSAMDLLAMAVAVARAMEETRAREAAVTSASASSPEVSSLRIQMSGWAVLARVTRVLG